MRASCRQVAVEMEEDDWDEVGGVYISRAPFWSPKPIFGTLRSAAPARHRNTTSTAACAASLDQTNYGSPRPPLGFSNSLAQEGLK